MRDVTHTWGQPPLLHLQLDTALLGDAWGPQELTLSQTLLIWSPNTSAVADRFRVPNDVEEFLPVCSESKSVSEIKIRPRRSGCPVAHFAGYLFCALLVSPVLLPSMCSSVQSACCFSLKPCGPTWYFCYISYVRSHHKCLLCISACFSFRKEFSPTFQLSTKWIINYRLGLACAVGCVLPSYAFTSSVSLVKQSYT